MRNLSKPELEKALLSAIKAEPLLVDQHNLTEEIFEVGAHRAIFRAIRSLVDRGQVPDDVSLLNITGESAMSILAELTLPAAGNAEYYVKELRKFEELRRLRRMGQWVQDAVEQGKDAQEIREKVDKGLTRLGDHSQLVRLAEVLAPAIDEVEVAYKNKGKLAGVPTGFDGLDRALNGLQGGLLYVLAARPSIGKTAMALTMALNAARRGHHIGFVSCEMGGTQLAKRAMAGEGRVDLLNMSAGMIAASDFHKLTDAAGKLYTLPLVVDDTPNPTLSHVKARARQMKRQGVEVIFVDYLTLIQYGAESTPRPERVGQIAKQLKQLARELDLPFVVLSQVRRDSEGREPNLADLRQSGEIEEDADVVCFLHREDRSGSDTRVMIAKNRQGPTWVFDVTFLPAYVRFENIA
jgi:replicative DNA helicase